MEPVRNVNVGRGYAKNSDSFKGLESAVKTNRTYLALEYLLDVVSELNARIEELEAVRKTSNRSKTKIESNDDKE